MNHDPHVITVIFNLISKWNILVNLTNYKFCPTWLSHESITVCYDWIERILTRSKTVWTDFDRVKICSNRFWPSQNLSKLSQLVGGDEKNILFGEFCPFFVLFFAFPRTICTWHRYLSKKLDPACFFWPQGPVIQSSATPQGSPPPTQQINIRNTNKLSWAINQCASLYHLNHFWQIDQHIYAPSIIISNYL